eukprot:1954969-Amphidinium_carterae.1
MVAHSAVSHTSTQKKYCIGSLELCVQAFLNDPSVAAAVVVVVVVVVADNMLFVMRFSGFRAPSGLTETTQICSHADWMKVINKHSAVPWPARRTCSGVLPSCIRIPSLGKQHMLVLLDDQKGGMRVGEQLEEYSAIL